MIQEVQKDREENMENSKDHSIDKKASSQ